MTKRLAVFLVLTLLLGLTLGCGLCGLSGGGEEAPPPDEEAVDEEATQPPSEEVQSGDETEDEDEQEEELSLSSITGGLQSLDSYRSHFKMTVEGTAEGETEGGFYEMDIEHVREPFAQRIVIQGEHGAGSFEVVHIGDMQYVVFEEGQCMSTSAGEDEAIDMEIFEPEDVIGGLEDARRVRPDESVNGVLCQHYVFDESAMTWGGFARAEGEVWVAVEGEYVVKYVLQAEGKDPVTGNEGQIEWEYEIRDVNAPIVIEPPSGCEAAESEFPMMADATEVTTMGGILMYTSPSSFDDVQAFYQEQMPADGWSDTGESTISPGSAILNYTKDGRTATITLSGEDGAVSVLIMSE